MWRLLVLLFPLCLLACAESDDGPIAVYPENFAVGGFGYVLSAELDSGSRFHVRGDTLELALDSMWTFGNCFLRSIELYQYYPSDSVLSIQVKLLLGNTGKTDCPQPLFRPDTVLKIPFSADWKKVREIRIEGNSHNEFYSEKPDTAKRAGETFKDSILVRNGSFLAESVSVYLDSSFGSPRGFPRRTKNDTAGILARVDSIRVDSFAYRLMKSVCVEIHDSCTTRPDTLWPSAWSSADTNLVPVREVCRNDTLSFCLTKNWANDSASLGDSVYEYLDTAWYASLYYVEKVPECASLDRGNFSSGAVAGRYFVTNHTIFVPAEDEPACGPAANRDWILYSLSKGEEVLDSVFADSLIADWKKASVGKDEDE